MTSAIRPPIKALALLSLACTTAGLAGEPVSSSSGKESAPLIQLPTANDWKFTLSAYGWLAGLEGTAGIKGFTSEVDVPFSKILDNLDMTASLNLEVQKGRWGGWIDGMYLKASAGGNTPDPLFDQVNLSVEQVMAEAAVFYRVWESHRGSLDLYAGARYMRMSGEISLGLSDPGVEQFSERLSARVIDEILRGARSKAAQVVEERKPEVVNQIASRAGAVLDNLQSIGEAHPGVITAIKRSERLQQAIRNAAAARVDEQLVIAQAKVDAAQAKIVAAKEAARRAVAKAEKALANEIETALRNSIPSEISGSKDWVDPFIGVRGSYHFTDSFYAVAKADIGGFGVSSDLAWQAYAALGYKLNARTSVELGYKYMSVDYTSDGFTNDMRTSGVLLNLGIKL